jgi:hypothetical protein
MTTRRRKLYCYVDETGQDARSEAFVVVAMVTEEQQEELRSALVHIEQLAGTSKRKWHKSRPERRLRYLALALEKQVAAGDVFFGVYKKPLPFFFPFIEVIERAIKTKRSPEYLARVFVDGIDRKKATELTNALRLRDVSLEMVRGRRDESEPLIRLADMWAGCIRAALAGAEEEKVLCERALRARRITALNELP